VEHFFVVAVYGFVVLDRLVVIETIFEEINNLSKAIPNSKAREWFS